MNKLKFDKSKIESIIKIIFPESRISTHEKFSTGLVNSVFKVRIDNPPKILVVKLSKLKNKDKISKNNEILNYLNKNNIPAPKVYFEGQLGKKFISVLEFSEGEVASQIYKNSNENIKEKISFNAGKNLRKIHSLEIPKFWIHQKFKIKNNRQWNKWTKHRIDKYLKFFNKKLPNHIEFLEKELTEFYKTLEKEDIKLVPLHWDYHFSNLNSSSKGEITGTFDFDNAMKGHNLADIGQTSYWIRFEMHDSKNSKYFLKGYKNNFSKTELKLIRGYYILHLLAISRSIWFRKRLSWILKEHEKIIEELKQNYNL